MRLQDQMGLAAQGVTASTFSLLSNTVSILVGLLFFGLLVSLSLGVAQFLEAYYTRTMSLTTLLVYNDPETSVDAAFNTDYRERLGSIVEIEQILYHDVNFADLAISQGKTTTAALRPAIPNDPEIERMELVAGENLRSFTSPARFDIVLPLNRAQSLSELPPEKLIGLEVALSFLRAVDAEAEDEEHSLYATIRGIVNETPDSCVYVPYEILATAERWQRELQSTASDDRGDSAPVVPSDGHATPSDADMEKTLDAIEASGDKARGEFTAAPVGALTAEEIIPSSDEGSEVPPATITYPSGNDEMEALHDTPVEKQSMFRYAKLEDAWQDIATEIEADALVYPHMRIHVDRVESLLALRNYFREQGNPTESVLDDVNTVRELRQYALLVGTCIGAITLIAALCSIFNTLLASVERRTREIGILRALGASRGNVLAIFLAEGVINTVIGGILAAIVMYFATRVANQWLFGRLQDNAEFAKIVELQPDLFLYPPWLFATIVLVGLAAALLASFFPALRACNVAPTTALRHE